ncbi:SDR family NAD(P)-dependent oxidoreductase [Aeromicrobium endophyticum]|uniref:SDR family NAD(P)-dependent oxidoreductase n=1 Tax=Aeromicrobium endophyticum TaxID=2292704 RepID=A0A371PAB7_9ACTN|nr:SDR family NAD(P)-dependent oxidoreductase [Aeromicrobium endophyticum]REK72905.1 SDR family NAD(P)-dependent oxidoreductase [Aeromicrobium endophyticum]
MDTSHLFSLEGRSALVTGGSRGIGRMIAEGFLAQGARVYISSRKAEACDQTATELSRLGTCVSLPADVSTLDGINELVAQYREHEPALDVLVNNAGATWGAPFDEFPESGWDKVMDVNVKSLFFLTQALKSDLAAATADRPAKVINISSVDGLTMNEWETYSYHASKAAVVHLTKRMALRLAADGIVVSGIAPGPFPTQMNKEADQLVGSVPAGRVGEPEDMAAAAIYLASRAGDYIVGSTIPVEGGLLLSR